MPEDSSQQTQPPARLRFSLGAMLLMIALVSVCLAMCMPFRGILPWFYYEEFNGVKRRLEGIEGAEIVGWIAPDRLVEPITMRRADLVRVRPPTLSRPVQPFAKRLPSLRGQFAPTHQ